MKYDVDTTWELCLNGMWDWIKAQIEAGVGRSAEALKLIWAEGKGYKYGEIRSNCFFCEYDKQESADCNCSHCPGKLVDPTFSCSNYEYHYSIKPLKFHAKLTELNKKRLAG